MTNRVPDVQRIAVLRANAIGDFVVCLPALEGLRHAYAGARIDLLGCPWHRELLRDRPGPVDRVVVVPASTGVRTDAPPDAPKALAAFFHRMREEHYDVALQLHGGGRWSNRFVRELGARITVGSRAFDAPPLDRTVAYTLYQPEILRFLEVVALVGAAPTTVRPRLEVTARDLAAASEVLDPDDDLVVIHPGASDPRRRWAPERFGQVGRALAADGLRLAVIGSGRDEHRLAAEVAGACGGMNLADRLSLPALVGLLHRARAVVGNDSGPIHLAQALATATVGIYWIGNLVNAGPPVRDRNRAVISWRTGCPACGAATVDPAQCRHRDSWVDDLDASQVLAEVRSVLADAPGALR